MPPDLSTARRIKDLDRFASDQVRQLKTDNIVSGREPEVDFRFYSTVQATTV